MAENEDIFTVRIIESEICDGCQFAAELLRYIDSRIMFCRVLHSKGQMSYGFNKDELQRLRVAIFGETLPYMGEGKPRH